MNTIKTIFSLSLLGAAVVHAAAVDTSYIEQETKAVQQIAVDNSDNRGMTLLFDDQVKPGRVVVSGTSKIARQAGVKKGDVLNRICTPPANLRHYKELVALAGGAGVYMTVGGQQVHGQMPAADVVKFDNNHIVLNNAMKFEGTGTVAVVDVQAGADIYEVCAPVHSLKDTVTAIAPFDKQLTHDGFLVVRGWLPMTYWMDRPDNSGVPAVIVPLPNWNPPQLAQAK